MAGESTELDILIKTKMGAEGARAAADNLKKLQGNAKQVNTSLKESNTVLGSMSTKLILMSGAAMAAMVKSAKDYVANVGTSEATSRRWLANTYAMESVYNRIGRIFAGQLIPYMETITKGAAGAAGFLEKNPQVANAGIQAAGIGIGIGALLKLAPGLKPLLLGNPITGGMMAGQVASTALGGTPWQVEHAKGVSESFLPGSSKGMDTTPINLLQTPAMIGQMIAIAAGEIGGSGAFSDVAKFFHLMPSAADAAKAAADNTAMDVYSTQQLQAMRGQVRADEMQERALKIQTAKMTRDFNIQQQYALEDFNRQRMRANRDFNLQLSFSEADFYRQRMRASRDFNIQMARNEQDHQRSVSRAAYDHEFEMFQIGMTGDAWSYYLAQRSYNLQKSRDEEDFQRQQSRAATDFQKSESDATIDYNISRARQIQQFAISQADAQKDFDIQRQRAEDQFKVQLGDMQVQFKEERFARKQAFMDQMNDLYGEEQARKILLQQFNQANLTDLQNARDAALRGEDTYKTTPIPSMPQYAAGGPVYRTGPIWAHAGEYVQSPAEAAGRLGGGGASGGRGGTTIIWNDHRTFDSRLSKEDRMLIQQDTVDFVLENIPDAGR